MAQASQHNLNVTIHEWTPEQKKANDEFYEALRKVWDLMTPWYKLEAPFSEAGAQKFRDNMRNGGGGWPGKKRLDDIAENIPVPSRTGYKDLHLRVFPAPKITGSTPKGIYLHFHGGGWTVGAADGEDEILHRISQKTGYTVASVEYRLAPKYPFPIPVEDCVDAALFLLSGNLEAEHGPLRVLGGESAGGHLTMAVTIALREKGIDVRSQIECLVLNYGCYDLSQTPSSRNFTDSLILGSVDMQNFNKAFIPDIPDARIPEVSPLFTPDFSRLPPAIFVVGSDDALFDDSLFGAIKWHMAGNETELRVFPGSKHGFCRLGGPDMAAGLAASEEFVIKHSRH